jgi:hypothetical protein
MSDTQHLGKGHRFDTHEQRKFNSQNLPPKSDHVNLPNQAAREEQKHDEKSAIDSSGAECVLSDVISASNNDKEERSDSASQTLALEWGHELLEEFQHKVLALCEKLWPDKIGRIQVEKMSGGGCNRIIGISVDSNMSVIFDQDEKRQSANSRIWNLKKFFKLLKSPKKMMAQLRRIAQPTYAEHSPTTSGQYILRIPWETEDHQVEQEAALLRFADRLTGFAVPINMHIDTTEGNPLGVPYVVQPRIPGKRLDELWSSLNYQQKLSLAKQVGVFLYSLSQYTYSYAGHIDPESISTSANLKTDIQIFELEYKNLARRNPHNKNKLAERQTPVEILQTRFRQWREWAVVPDKPDFEYVPYTKMAEIAGKINWGPEDMFYINHGDFFPRNILAQIVDNTSAEITGILDWDMTNIAPASVAFQCPYWLWNWSQYTEDEEDPCKVWDPENFKPKNEEGEEMGQVFEDMVGETFLMYANAPDSIFARLLWDWAERGICTSWICDFAKESIEKWEVRE